MKELGTALSGNSSLVGVPQVDFVLFGHDLTQMGNPYLAAAIIPVLGLAILACVYGLVTMLRVFIRTHTPLPIALFATAVLLATQISFSKLELTQALNL